MSIFGTSRIDLSFQHQSYRFLSKSDGLRIKNGGTKIDPPLNLSSAMELKPKSKHNQNHTLKKLQNLHIDLKEPSRSKMFLEIIPMSSRAITIQHLVYINTEVVSGISCLYPFYLAKSSTLWIPSSSTIHTPPLCTNFKNI